MSESDAPLTGPDLGRGIELSAVPRGGALLGHVDGEPVMIVRSSDSDHVYAIAPKCTHYGGPLNEGLIEGTMVRCPWHHARFDLRTGEAIAAPALHPVACWRVERRGTRIELALSIDTHRPAPPPRSPESVIIIGAGAAGNAAAEMLRREGYAGPITLIGAEQTPPVDRPNLSKDYLAGTAPEEWVPLHDEAFYAAHHIELVLGTRVVSFDPSARTIRLADGTTRSYGALLLATGAEPVRLAVPGSDAPFVHALRSFADSKAIIARATSKGAARVVVVGASFIGLEAAASLRTRGLEVRVVAPGARPLERVLGPELGDFVRALHEEHGVRFDLGHTLRAIEPGVAVLDDGSRLEADLIVAGIGVRPATALAEHAGLEIDGGIVVDSYLETSAPNVFAAGDIARYPDPHTGKRVRIEHWVVAERQGQAAARNIVGRAQPFTEVPFFWSQHYDVPIAYVGHAETWDRIEVAGSIADRNCVVAFRNGGRVDAIATIYRDTESLRAESMFGRNDQAGLETLMEQARAGTTAASAG
jgi:apoptosis-inducing factor 3